MLSGLPTEYCHSGKICLFWFNKLFTEAHQSCWGIADYTLKKLMNLTLAYKMRSFKCMVGQTKHPYRKWSAQCVMHNALSATYPCYWFSNLKQHWALGLSLPQFSLTEYFYYLYGNLHSSLVSLVVLQALLGFDKHNFSFVWLIFVPTHSFKIPPSLPFSYLTKSPIMVTQIKAHPFSLLHRLIWGTQHEIKNWLL